MHTFIKNGRCLQINEESSIVGVHWVLNRPLQVTTFMLLNVTGRDII